MTRQLRKGNGRVVSGWVILDKPKGLCSTEAVSRVKKLYNAEKAGHAGTLDPIASGLLPVAIGEATKTVPYVMAGTKIYRFTVAWGEERSTDDLEGEIMKTSPSRPTEEEIKAILPEYTGVILQVPPRFSAIRVNGLRAYDLARSGQNVDIPPRTVEISMLKLTDITSEGNAIFEIKCSKGTYVRSLARDMGHALSCYGYIIDLRRIAVMPFTTDRSVTLAALEDACPSHIGLEMLPSEYDFSRIDAFLVTVGVALEGMTQYSVADKQATCIRSGNPVHLCGQRTPMETDKVCINHKGKILAIGYIERGKFQPIRVFRS